jgi:hypothetical protein
MYHTVQQTLAGIDATTRGPVGTAHPTSKVALQTQVTGLSQQCCHVMQVDNLPAACRILCTKMHLDSSGECQWQCRMYQQRLPSMHS